MTDDGRKAISDLGNTKIGLRKPSSVIRRPSRSPLSSAEVAITIAAALEMLILVGGLLWAINTPQGATLWPRILLVAAAAVLAAVIAIFACAPAVRAAHGAEDSADSSE